MNTTSLLRQPHDRARSSRHHRLSRARHDGPADGRRLAGAGFKLRVFDVSQKAVSDFVGAHPSALATASAKAAAEGADALITMLPDGKIVRQALLEGRDAAREGLGAARW